MRAAPCGPRLRRGLALLGTAAVTAGVAAAIVAPPAAATAGVARSQQGPPERTPDSAAVVYAQDCASCHGVDGRGTSRGPTLVGVGRASVDYYVSSGRMPLSEEAPWLPQLRDAQPDVGDERDYVPRRGPAVGKPPVYAPELVRGLVDYVDALTGGGGPDIPQVDVDPELAGEGGRLYRLNCAACHSWSGGGGALYGRRAPPLEPATPVQVAESMIIGPGEMPAFPALSPREVDAVTSYVVGPLRAEPVDAGFGLFGLGSAGEGLAAVAIGLGGLLLVSAVVGGRAPSQVTEDPS